MSEPVSGKDSPHLKHMRRFLQSEIARIEEEIAGLRGQVSALRSADSFASNLQSTVINGPMIDIDKGDSP